MSDPTPSQHGSRALLASLRVVAQYQLSGAASMAAIFWALGPEKLPPLSGQIVAAVPMVAILVWIVGYRADDAVHGGQPSLRSAVSVATDQMYKIGRLLTTRGIASAAWYYACFGSKGVVWVAALWPFGYTLMAIGYACRQQRPYGLGTQLRQELRYQGQLLIRDAALTPISALCYVGPTPRMWMIAAVVPIAAAHWALGWRLENPSSRFLLPAGASWRKGLGINVGDSGALLFAAGLQLLILMGSLSAPWRFAALSVVPLACTMLYIGYAADAAGVRTRSLPDFGQYVLDRFGEPQVLLLQYYGVNTPLRFIARLVPNASGTGLNLTAMGTVALIPFGILLHVLVLTFRHGQQQIDADPGVA